MTKEQVCNGHKFGKSLIESYGIRQSKKIGGLHVQYSIGMNLPGSKKIFQTKPMLKKMT